MQRILPTLASAVALCSVSPAHASVEDSAGDGSTLIVTAPDQTTAEAAVAQTPGGAAIVSYADYADKTVMSLRDALVFTPGVYVQPRYGQEVRISVRGSGLSRSYHMRGLTLLQDGVPINLADDNGDFQELEPIFLDHLEIYRGANALRFGSGTLGGAINGVTPNGRNARGLYARLDGGSFNTLRGLLAYGGADQTADYWIGASIDRSDGDRDHAKRWSARVHGNVGLQLSDTIDTRFYGSINRIRQELPGALTLTNARTNPRRGNFVGDQQRNIDSFRLQNRTRIDLGDATLDVGLFLNVKQLDHPTMMVIDQKSLDHGAYFRLDMDRDWYALTVGGEWRRGTIASRRYANVDGRPGAAMFAGDLDARTANLYGEVRVRPIANLSLIAGGVYADGWRRQHQTYGMMGVMDAVSRAQFDAFSPRFGVLWEAVPHVQFYANVSRSAEFPTFVELLQTTGFVPVQAQRAWTYELGTRGEHGIVTWDVSFYRADIRGEMLQYSVTADIPAATFNAGRTRHQGVEAGITLTPASWLQLRQVYNFNDFRFRNDHEFGDNRLPVAPRHLYRADVRVGTEALHVTPNLEWVPQGAWADYANTTRTTGYALLGLTAGATVRPGVDVFIDARNLTNKRAIGDIAAVIRAAATSAIYYPVERRAVFGGVRARF